METSKFQKFNKFTKGAVGVHQNSINTAYRTFLKAFRNNPILVFHTI